MIVLKWLVVAAAIGYFGALAALFLAQRSIIFPIPQTVATSPLLAGFPQAEEHVLITSDGERVIVWHVPAKPGYAVVIYFPGNGDTLAGSVGRFQAITSDGTGLVALSFRGYSGSSGQPTEPALLLDAAAAYTFTSALYRSDQIVVWGFSLGSGVAVALAAEQRVGKLVLEAPYTSIADLAAAAFPWMPVRWLVRDPFRSDQRIARVAAPVLIMHGARDPTIPIRFGERLFALAREPKQFVRFPEGGHDDLANYGAIETARQFIGGPGG